MRCHKRSVPTLFYNLLFQEAYRLFDLKFYPAVFHGHLTARCYIFATDTNTHHQRYVYFALKAQEHVAPVPCAVILSKSLQPNNSAHYLFIVLDTSSMNCLIYIEALETTLFATFFILAFAVMFVPSTNTVFGE